MGKNKIDMEITDIRITQENHSRWNPEYDQWNSSLMNQCLDIHNDVTEYIQGKLWEGLDWGGKYASFLDNVKIDSNSDNGWWSYNAVDHDNINAFVEYYLETYEGERINFEFVDNYNMVRDFLQKSKKIRHTHCKVKELISDFIILIQ